jgi:predicted transport protein
MAKIIIPEAISLLNHQEIDERMIQEKIANDPKILGLGNLVLKDKERVQPRAGRLDLLFQDIDTNRRYEVEVQLGRSDESHIIRTIEYWDIERKRYPQYDHCAVIIAEDITTRFLNVISLFNGSIPLIAIQMKAFKMGDDIALDFTTVLDELPLGLVDEDEEIQEVTDRNYWLEKGDKKTVEMADFLLKTINEFTEEEQALKYNKFYIGLAHNNHPNNFVVFRPKRTYLNIEIKLPYSDDVQKKINEAGIDDMGYLKRWNIYRLRLTKHDIDNNLDVLRKLFKEAYDSFR